MEITAKMVMALREKTGVGMMDCKKALKESEGDMDKAVEWLRKKGLSKAAKRADRATGSGVIGVFVGEDNKKVSLVELNCETDFVAKNDDFTAMAKLFAAHVAQTGSVDVEALNGEKLASDESKTVGDMIADAIAKIGESIKIGKVLLWNADDANLLGYYVHTGSSAVGLVEFSEVGDKDLVELGKFLGMHIVAARPTYFAPADVPAEVLEKEKEIYRAEALQSGKPEQVIDRIAEGKLNKYFQDTCLLKQLYVKDPQGKTPVDKVLSENGVKLIRYARLAVGE